MGSDKEVEEIVRKERQRSPDDIVNIEDVWD